MSEEYVLNQPTGFSCPECGGTLAKVESDPIPKFVCHIGHILTGAAMLEAQAERIEYLLTGALAMLNERRELCRQMIDDVVIDNSTQVRAIMKESTEIAESVRDLLNGHGIKRNSP